MPEARHAMTNGHWSLQLGVWGALCVDGGQKGKTPRSQDLKILQFTFAKNAKNKPSWSIYPKLQFHEFC